MLLKLTIIIIITLTKNFLKVPLTALRTSMMVMELSLKFNSSRKYMASTQNLQNKIMKMKRNHRRGPSHKLEDLERLCENP